MKSSDRLFGTDGIRGRYGKGWLAPGPVSALGRVLGQTLPMHAHGGRALVGHDGRRSGPELERALARGLKAAGVHTISGGLTTTPGLAWYGRERDFDLTVMISASHNPARDNGIKIFGARGDKLADATEDEIERTLRSDPTPIAGDENQVVEYDGAYEDAYIEHLYNVCPGLDLAGMTIAIDCANGGGSRIAPHILERLGAQVVAIAHTPDGDNINQNCGSTHPKQLQRAVQDAHADIGIALDGDADRCMLVDEHGALINGDGILTVLARNAMSHGRLKDPRIVATVMSNKGLQRALRDLSIQVLTVGVGDRCVVEALRNEKLALGGEQSGHIICGADNFFIGDGTYTALRVLAAMREERATLAALTAPYTEFPQILINVPVSSKPDLSTIPAVFEAVQRVETDLGDDGRVLLRYSGTESLARVMVEGPDQTLIHDQAEQIAALIRAEIGA